MSPLLAAAALLSPHVGPDGATAAAWARAIGKGEAASPGQTADQISRAKEARRWTRSLGPAGRAAARPLLVRAGDGRNDSAEIDAWADAAAAAGVDALPAICDAIVVDPLFEFIPGRTHTATYRASAGWRAWERMRSGGPVPPDPAVDLAVLDALRVYFATVPGDEPDGSLNPRASAAQRRFDGLIRAGQTGPSEGQVGLRVVPLLVELLEHPSGWVRVAATKALRQVSGTWGMTPAEAAVRRADLAAAVPVLVRAVRERGSRTAVASLLSLAPADHRDLIFPDLLAAWGEPPAGTTGAPASRVRWAVGSAEDFATVLRGMDYYAARDPADAARVRAALAGNLPRRLKVHGLNGLANMRLRPGLSFRSPAVVEPLRTAAEALYAVDPPADPDGFVARSFAALIEQWDGAVGIPPDTPPAPRTAPPPAPAYSRAEMYTAALASGGLNDPAPEIHAYAVAGLAAAAVGPATAATALLTAAQDPDPRVRAAAAYALGERPDAFAASPAAATAALRRRLGDSYASVRLPAVRAWRALGLDPAALVPLAADPNPAVALAAGESEAVSGSRSAPTRSVSEGCGRRPRPLRGRPR